MGKGIAATVAIATLLALYVCAYRWMLVRSVAVIRADSHRTQMTPEYRVDGKAVEWFFMPVHQTDRVVCPWEWDAGYDF